MINAWHLLWIIPLSAFFGFMACAVLTVAKQADATITTDEKIMPVEINSLTHALLELQKYKEALALACRELAHLDYK